MVEPDSIRGVKHIERHVVGMQIAIITRMRRKKVGGFTLVEIMIVVAIIALLAAIAVPGFLRARKRSQATTILNDLRLIDGALDQYAIETNKGSGAPCSPSDWAIYLNNKGSKLTTTQADVFGNPYGTQTVDALPKVPAASYATLSDVANTAFWSPYDHF
jgi:prepilin-type N-terminal cleavage/methylation domain-containing protein